MGIDLSQNFLVIFGTNLLSIHNQANQNKDLTKDIYDLLQLVQSLSTRLAIVVICMKLQMNSFLVE